MQISMSSGALEQLVAVPDTLNGVPLDEEAGASQTTCTHGSGLHCTAQPLEVTFGTSPQEFDARARAVYVTGDPEHSKVWFSVLVTVLPAATLLNVSLFSTAPPGPRISITIVSVPL